MLSVSDADANLWPVGSIRPETYRFELNCVARFGLPSEMRSGRLRLLSDTGAYIETYVAAPDFGAGEILLLLPGYTPIGAQVRRLGQKRLLFSFTEALPLPCLLRWVASRYELLQPEQRVDPIRSRITPGRSSGKLPRRSAPF